MLYVARIERHDEGTFAYIFDAEDEDEARSYGEELAGDPDDEDSGQLVEVLTADAFVTSEGPLELCTF